MAAVMGSSLACFSKKVASFTQYPGPDLGWAQATPLLEQWVMCRTLVGWGRDTKGCSRATGLYSAIAGPAELQLWCQAAGGNTSQKQKLNSATNAASCTRNRCLYEVSPS